MKKLLLAISVISLAAVVSPAWADGPKQCTKDSCRMEEQQAAKGTAVDPVCGMDIAVKDAKYQETYNGTTYYFCSASCKKDFDRNPSKYMQKKK